MRASLDTNAIIHFYKARCQSILFDLFEDGVFIYEQIRNVELEHHGQEVIEEVDKDIEAGKIEVYTFDNLKSQFVHRIFENHVNENRLLYGTGDLGEVYAISLAQTIGGYFLITDDTKQGGPYMSLMQFEDDVKPFNFADVLLLRYLLNKADSDQTVKDYNAINTASDMQWSFKSQIARFIRRFWKDPYTNKDVMWMKEIVSNNNIKPKSKFLELNGKMEQA